MITFAAWIRKLTIERKAKIVYNSGVEPRVNAVFLFNQILAIINNAQSVTAMPQALGSTPEGFTDWAFVIHNEKGAGLPSDAFWRNNYYV